MLQEITQDLFLGAQPSENRHKHFGFPELFPSLCCVKPVATFPAVPDFVWCCFNLAALGSVYPSSDERDPQGWDKFNMSLTRLWAGINVCSSSVPGGDQLCVTLRRPLRLSQTAVFLFRVLLRWWQLWHTAELFFQYVETGPHEELFQHAHTASPYTGT